ncbi:MAG: alpha/beta fold hydrolase [Candidatus Heimdallarchaeota archaeon]
MVDKFYIDVPIDQKEPLFQFRRTHQYNSLSVNEIHWDYLKSGENKPNLLLLTGGTRVGESFALLPHLEKRYNVISPTYPIVHTIREMVDGIAAIVKKEQFENFLLLGTFVQLVFFLESSLYCNRLLFNYDTKW